MALNVGSRLGSYEVLSAIGAGGMGVRLRQGFGGFPLALAGERVSDE